MQNRWSFKLSFILKIYKYLSRYFIKDSYVTQSQLISLKLKTFQYIEIIAASNLFINLIDILYQMIVKEASCDHYLSSLEWMRASVYQASVCRQEFYLHGEIIANSLFPQSQWDSCVTAWEFDDNRCEPRLVSIRSVCSIWMMIY